MFASKINPSKGTPLHVAAFKGREAVVKFLIANGADINAKSKEGYTPLYMTAFEGQAGTAEILIAAGADVRARSHDGSTLLQVATQNGHKEFVAVLRKMGAVD